MELISVRTKIRGVARRWDRAYFRAGSWVYRDKQIISEALHKLDVETATAGDVERVIGNGSWCEEPVCDECDSVVDHVVRVGGEPSYDSSTADICINCLEDASRLSRSVMKGLKIGDMVKLVDGYMGVDQGQGVDLSWVNELFYRGYSSKGVFQIEKITDDDGEDNPPSIVLIDCPYHLNINQFELA